MAIEKIITTTGIKASDAEKHGLDKAKAIEKLNLTKAPAFGKKSELPIGRFIADSDDKAMAFLIYMVEERDIDAEYEALSKADQRIAWADGFKRKHVNAPNHQDVRAALGLAEQGSKAKVIEATQLKTIKAMLEAGIPVEQVVRIAAGLGINEDMVKSLL